MNTTALNAVNPTMPSSTIRVEPVDPPLVAPIEDIRHRVASALNIPASLVHVEDYRAGAAGLIQRCSGTADGERFFAKLFLVDPFPVPPRFATPSEELSGVYPTPKPLREQITVEWKMAQKIRSLVGTRNVPAPLGHSVEHRILVFQEVSGLRMDRFANYHWPGHGKLTSLSTAVFHAGAWLRRLHESSAQATETVDFKQNAADLARLAHTRAIDLTSSAGRLLRMLEAAGRELDEKDSFPIPVALCHGDFTLPNLLWNPGREHLWVIDFELSGRRPILHDLCTMIFDLRKRLLHPLTLPRVIRECEESFWKGYGPIPRDLMAVVNALAASRVLYSSLPRISTLRDRRGWKGGVKASIYKLFFKDLMLARLLRAN